jgi:4-diphosphocytidyl-2-C-methyl-D-erythritol kinase
MIFSVRAKAKINLFLKVLGKRVDQYHKVTSVLQTIDLEDELLFEKSDSGAIELRSSVEDIPLDATNLVWRAIESVKKFVSAHRVPAFRVEIRKRIPVGAGLGGGSADAAATLVALNSLCDLHLTDDQMFSCAAEVGMDVPFFLKGGTMRATERGDVLEPVRSKAKYWLVVVFPDVAISTRKAYELIDAGIGDDAAQSDQALLGALEQGNVKQMARLLYNSFERVIIPEYPIIAEVKRRLLQHGCAGALMSGSGSAVFGIVSDRETAEAIANELQTKYPFVHACSTAEHSITTALGHETVC